VPQAGADDFRAAFSKGRHFNAHVRDACDDTQFGAQTADEPASDDVRTLNPR
jgi:hypothetical protein